jgi:hypothetical protein
MFSRNFLISKSVSPNWQTLKTVANAATVYGQLSILFLGHPYY